MYANRERTSVKTTSCEKTKKENYIQVVQESSSSSSIRLMDINGGSQSAKMGMGKAYERMRLLAKANAVVVFTTGRCCMGHVVKQLLIGLGVGPTIVELDRDAAGREIHELLLFLLAGKGPCQPLPAVFIGGKFLGGVETVMACHINATLVPLLKNAGALWL